jgi:pimeloyl-ACP methyl ester carboxylesterase
MAEAPVKVKPDTIVMVHGLWMTPRSWEHWKERYEARGYTVHAPAWPGFEVEVEALNADPAPMDDLEAETVIDSYETFIKNLDSDPIIVGHSWGTLVALAMALENAEEVSGLVLMSGFYYPIGPRQTVRIPAAVFSLMRRLMAPDTMRRVFAPCRVPERFIKTYPMSRAMGLSQMLAVDEEAAVLLPAVSALSQRYRELSLPLCLIAGSEDRIVDTDRQSVRLQEELTNCTFYRVPGCGHMVHHVAPELVMAAIVAVGIARSEERAARPPVVVTAPRRHWLHIGESPVAA